MNFRRYLLSSVYRSPDEPAVEPEVVEVAAVEPVNALDGAAEPAADAPVVEEPAPAPAPAAADHGNKGKTPWYMGRINEETNRRNAEAEARRAAETRAANAEALLERLQNGGKEGDAPAPKARTEPAPQEFETAVQAEAARRDVMRQCDTVAGAGFAKFPDWAEKTNILGALNAATPDFVMDVVAVDPANAHKLLYDLANDPERAARLVAMNPRSRTVELTRMSMATAPAADAKPAPKPAPAVEAPKLALSRAPAPKPNIAPHAAAPEVDPRTPEGNDKMSDAQFETWYKSTYMKRTG